MSSAYVSSLVSDGLVEFVLPDSASGLVVGVGVVRCVGVASVFFIAVCDDGNWHEPVWGSFLVFVARHCSCGVEPRGS